MKFRGVPKAKSIWVIALSSVSLFLVILYGILSCTLLNPAFYHFVFESRAVQSSFAEASGKITPEGTALFTGQSLKENAYSLTEGILRLIKQNDMSLSDIQFETESTQSIRSTMMAAVSEQTTEVPEISRIHPFVISYLLPGSENAFTILFSVQKVYSTLRSIIPLLGLFSMLLLFLSGKTAENTKAVFISTGTAVISSGVFLLLFRYPLLLSPLSGILPDSGAAVLIVRQATACLVIFTAITGALLFLPALTVSLHPVKKALNRFSRAFAILVIILAGLFVILFNSEVFANTAHTMKTQAERMQVKILNREDGTVHSLTIKLRETDTQAPVSNVKLTLIRMDEQSEPLQTTAISDATGDVRFILPEGLFLLVADPATVPRSLECFQPVMLSLDRPDSSWYTFYLPGSSENNFKRETPDEENFRFPDHPIPLLK